MRPRWGCKDAGKLLQQFLSCEFALFLFYKVGPSFLLISKLDGLFLLSTFLYFKIKPVVKFICYE